LQNAYVVRNHLPHAQELSLFAVPYVPCPADSTAIWKKKARLRGSVTQRI